MLSPDEIRDLLRCLPDTVALAVLVEMSDPRDRVYEAARIAHEYLGARRGDELIASLARGTATA